MAETSLKETPVWLAEEWARQLTTVIETMTGESPFVTYEPISISAFEIDPSKSELLWWEQQFNLGSKVLVWFGAVTRSWHDLGTRVLHNAGEEGGNDEAVRRTYLEIVSQTLSGMAGALSSRVRKDVFCTGGRTAAPTTSTDFTCCSFEIGIGGLALPVLAAFSNELGEVPDLPAPPDTPRQRPDSGKEAEEIPAAKSLNSIDLLLDVELPVSISFGHAQVLLKDVIKLTTGSIVELNRSVAEPVDVLVNNCVIARGEVVVVEGNFGIRIQHVISRQERLRTVY